MLFTAPAMLISVGIGEINFDVLASLLRKWYLVATSLCLSICQPWRDGYFIDCSLPYFQK
jgi:hypothetical protein